MLSYRLVVIFSTIITSLTRRFAWCVITGHVELFIMFYVFVHVQLLIYVTEQAQEILLLLISTTCQSLGVIVLHYPSLTFNKHANIQKQFRIFRIVKYTIRTHISDTLQYIWKSYKILIMNNADWKKTNLQVACSSDLSIPFAFF